MAADIAAEISDLAEALGAGAMSEGAKHKLQAIIAQEVRETLTLRAEAILREIVREANNIEQPPKVTKSEVLAKVAQETMKSNDFAGSWRNTSEVTRLISEKLAETVESSVAWNEARAIIEEARPQIIEQALKALSDDTHKILIEQIAYWRGQVEEGLREVKARVDQLEQRR